MQNCHRLSADTIRSQIERGLHDPLEFRQAVLNVPPDERDAWLDLTLGLAHLPEDGPDLPKGCVPYIPSSVDALLRVVDQARVRSSDVFVDVGSGLGRATTFIHLLTGAAAIGIEVQSGLVLAARDLAKRLALSRVSTIEGDASTLTSSINIGSVFFFYCPFSGPRLAKLVADLGSMARTRPLSVCCIDLELPPCPWLLRQPRLAADLTVYRSTPERAWSDSLKISAQTCSEYREPYRRLQQ